MIPFNRLNSYLRLNTNKVVKEYDQTIFTLDIENSNGYIVDGVACPFDYSQPPAYYADKEKVSLLYLWQFGVDDVVFYGRTLDQLKPALDYLATRPCKSVCFIHNLAHEFMFLLNIIKYDSVFARKAHRPIKCNYGNLEFRCTYMLTRQSLKSVGKNVGLEKIDDYNYDDIKTPETPLTKLELDYGSRDTEIVYRLVENFRKEYKLIQKIPLTQTGRPRLEVKKLYARDMDYHYKMRDLLPRNVSEYALLRTAFVGGWVHGNYYYVGVNLKKCVWAYDITSSYPTQMVLHKYPQTAWTLSEKGDEGFYIDNDSFVCIVKVQIDNLETIGYNDYISHSKIFDDESQGVKSENGRIYKAERVTLVCTSVDYHILKECYSGDFTILKLWYSRAGYLDKRYVEYVLDLYENKVKLTGTGDPVKEELRARSKELLNSLYGMMVSALVYDDVVFTGNEWKQSETDPAKVAAHASLELNRLRDKPYKLFTSYSHGLFVTAYARAALWAIIKEIQKDVVYHDTDSVYCVGRHRDIIDRYNADIKRKLLDVCERRRINPERMHPRDVNGVEQWLGVYTCDNDDKYGGKPFHEFKMLGAKRYCYRPREGGKIKITVAGVSKVDGVKALHDSIDKFKDGLLFDYKECSKLLPHYNTDQPVTKWIDRDGRVYVSRETFGITLQPARYRLSLGQSFLDVLASLGSLSNQFSEMDINDLKRIANI